MSNPLTGDFEAAVEVRVEALNRLLATLHQVGASKEASPKLLHSITARIGEAPKEPMFALAEWFLSRNFGPRTAEAVPEPVLEVVQTNPLNVQKSVVDVFKAVGSTESIAGSISWAAKFPEWFAVRGIVKAQLSTVSVSFPEGSTSEVTVRCQVRALYIPDTGTAELPAPLHGEVQVTFRAQYHATGATGQPVL